MDKSIVILLARYAICKQISVSGAIISQVVNPSRAYNDHREIHC